MKHFILEIAGNDKFTKELVVRKVRIETSKPLSQILGRFQTISRVIKYPRLLDIYQVDADKPRMSEKFEKGRGRTKE